MMDSKYVELMHRMILATLWLVVENNVIIKKLLFAFITRYSSTLHTRMIGTGAQEPLIEITLMVFVA